MVGDNQRYSHHTDRHFVRFRTSMKKVNQPTPKPSPTKEQKATPKGGNCPLAAEQLGSASDGGPKGLEGATASFLLAFGCVLATISLFMPPEGEIDGSVLMLFAQILVYAGSIFGVKIYIKDLIKRANK